MCRIVSAGDKDARARIRAKRRARAARDLAVEQTQAVRALAGLPHKEEDLNVLGGASDTSSSSAEQIRLDPYCVIDYYFHEHEDKGKDSRR